MLLQKYELPTMKNTETKQSHGISYAAISEATLMFSKRAQRCISSEKNTYTFRKEHLYGGGGMDLDVVDIARVETSAESCVATGGDSRVIDRRVRVEQQFDRCAPNLVLAQQTMVVSRVCTGLMQTETYTSKA